MRILFFFFLFIATSIYGKGQTKTDTIFKLYDYQWKEIKNPDAAVFYSVAYPEQSNWRRFDFFADINKFKIDGYYSDKELTKKTGPFRYYNKEGKVISTGIYHDNKKNGLWKSWHGNGKLSDSTFYADDVITEKKSWYESGKLWEEISQLDNGLSICKNYFENGNNRWEGYIDKGLKTGKWLVYEVNGTKSMEIEYEKDSAIQYVCYDNNGKIQKSKCIFESEATFKGGDNDWLKYLQKGLGKHLNRNPGLQRLNGTLVILFVVDTDGSITNARVEFTNQPKLNKIALALINESPKWNNAIQYNQPVKAYRLQPLTFVGSSN